MAVLSDFTAQMDAIMAIATIKREIINLKSLLSTGVLTSIERKEVLDQISALQSAIANIANV